ncbi:heavy-metal-associated domain-containing protein [Corynebacterium comes]|uniref:Copper-exporting P-type ATPase A n=1 Tax=Corynebacterium comes TaxID=2675218 RepID=A0A6B8VEJ5_9CORY|nr:heavy-metal-associated domain-containing protein [Corynebacterium comes]QGU03672.1 Copper-exporting P-type ATPase A [Corynebacterium comes]
MAHRTLNQLPLTDSRPSSGCGCGCGSSPAADVPDRAATAGSEIYQVAGMTCGGCVRRVTEAVQKLSGVKDVHVDLVRGGVSTLTVTGGASPEDVRQALSMAGYPVTA